MLVLSCNAVIIKATAHMDLCALRTIWWVVIVEHIKLLLAMNCVDTAYRNHQYDIFLFCCIFLLNIT